MLRNPVRTFEHKYFYSMIDRDDPQAIPNYYAQNIENWIIRNRGELEMRDGLTARGTSPSKTNLGSGVLYQANGTKKFVRVITGSGNTSKFQVSDNGTTWTDMTGTATGLNSNAVWVMVQANNNLYAVNGSDSPRKFNGTTMSTVAGIPNGIAIEWWKNRLWVFGVVSVPDRNYYSDANDPETFGGSSFVNVNLGDSSRGTGLKGVGGATGRLYMTKENSVWYLTGNSASDFAIDPLTFEFGIASHESLVQVGNEVWGVDLDGNIRGLYRTSQDTPFGTLKSRHIQTKVSGVNRVSIRKSSAVVFNNFALFFIPYGVDSRNSIVFCWDLLANDGRGGWVIFTNWNIARATIFQESSVPKLFLHDSREGNGQTYEWTGTSDNGTAITAKYETKIYDFGYSVQEKIFAFAYQTAPALGDVDLRFYSSVDRFYYTLLKLIDLQGTGNKLLGVNWTLGVDRLGSGGFVQERIGFTDGGGTREGFTLQIKIEAESASVKMKARQFTVHYRLKGLR